jgi:hypothetical protein
MKRQFEVFKNRFHTPANKHPRVTLNATRGVFYLNEAAYKALGESKAVLLMYDKPNQVIGLKPVTDSTRHAYPIRRQKKAASYVISARRFCEIYALAARNGLTIFYPVLEGGILILEQDKMEIAVTRRRRAKGEG